ncbi:conjugal transfer protein TraC [Acetobacter persici]|uniref:DUF3560 domain-containing protein n=1 Tax=Acetobacter persici TaxID=1076596 RepID=UPI000A3C01DD|nr:DUF3560 domain-containing protein [Acetobacter persici]OUI86832.1 conjugal transfer protein TraC [Acetobacter persici]
MSKNAYEARQEARRERLEARAAQARSESDSLAKRSSEMAERIPFGQPILVGHHSEGWDRRFRERIGHTMTRAVDAQKKAEYYENKAASVGRGGISSDDPDAIKKLQAELAELDKASETMKAYNKLIKKGDREGLAKQYGLNEDQIDKLMTKDYAGRIGIPAYMLSNNRANASRIRKRIAQLEAAAQRQDVEQEGKGYTYREDTDENRVMFIFDGKPAEETRNVLKRHGFRWSPSRGAWVRQLNDAGIYAAQCARKILD